MATDQEPKRLSEQDYRRRIDSLVATHAKQLVMLKAKVAALQLQIEKYLAIRDGIAWPDEKPGFGESPAIWPLDGIGTRVVNLCLCASRARQHLQTGMEMLARQAAALCDETTEQIETGMKTNSIE
jgi:hypothetical protein